MNILLIFLGGGLGAVTRWGLSSGIQQLAEKTSLHRFPVGILTCNVIGCFLTGCLFGMFAQKHPAWVFPLLATGFLGGFTTFSAFGRDTFAALESGFTTVALGNVLLSVVLGVLAVWAGLRLCSP